MRGTTRDALYVLLLILGVFVATAGLVWLVCLVLDLGPAQAATCTPDLANYTPTPTIQGQHDFKDTVLYRVYAQRSMDTTWPWHVDITYWPGDAMSDPSAPSITMPWPIQRVVPTSVQLEDVNVMIKAVSADNVESAPSNVVTVCMPQICVKPGPCQ